MAREWIQSDLAWKLVAAVTSSDHETFQTLTDALESGYLQAWADRFVSAEGEEAGALIPRDFWSDGRGCKLTFNWELGEFTSIGEDGAMHQALDTYFDYVELLRLVPPLKRPAAIRAVSVDENPSWIPANALVNLVEASAIGLDVKTKLIGFCEVGRMVARCSRMEQMRLNRSPAETEAFIEWDIPLRFWRGLSESSAHGIDWETGSYSGEVNFGGIVRHIKLSGIHFYREGLSAIGLADPKLSEFSQPAPASRGRKPGYDWTAAKDAVWGQIYRGEFIPKTQADVETKLQFLLAKGDKEPSVSTVRPYARSIWQQLLE